MFLLLLASCSTPEQECLFVVEERSRGTNFDLAGEPVNYYNLNGFQVSKEDYETNQLGECVYDLSIQTYE